MKRFFFFLFFMLPVLVEAQNFEGGFIGGITGSQVDGDNYAGYHRLGLDAGFYVRRSLSKKNAWQLEVKYEGKGASAYNGFNANQQGPNDLYHLALRYVEIPVIYVNTFNPRFSFFIGAEAGYLFNGRVTDQLGDLYNIFDKGFANFRHFEIAGLTGLFYNVTDRFKVCIRFSYSLTPVMQYEGGVATRPWFRNLYNNGLGLCTFIRLDQ
jgi:hypothetical protein